MKKGLILHIILFYALISFSQNLAWLQIDSVDVFQNEKQLLNPWAGGMNTFTLKNVDYDFDGDLDLLAYEDANQDILLWENKGENYQFKINFYDRPVNVFIEILDINNDEIPDLITSVNRKLAWYKGIINKDTLQFDHKSNSFKLNQSLINADESPGFADLNNNGNYDFILNDATGQFIELYTNTTQIKDSITYEITDSCWGAIQYFYVNDSIIFNTDCKETAKNRSLFNQKHIVPTLILQDLNNDEEQDLILSSGTINYVNVLMNEGTSEKPIFNSSTSYYPANEPLHIKNRPYINKTIINNSSDNSIVCSSQYLNWGTEPYDISWLYQKDENQHFQLVTKQFLVDEMIDVGKFSIPSFYDVDQDGLVDLLISATIPDDSIGVNSKVYFYKNTGTSEIPEFTFVEDDFLELSSLDDTTLDIAFGDFDNDADDDMVIGGASGKIHYFKNDGQTFTYNGAILFKDSVFQLDFGVNASPAVIDYNQDGLADILIGKSSGKLELITNLGIIENGTPIFEITNNCFANITTQIIGQLDGHSKPYFMGNLDSLNLYIGSTNGNIYRYTNINLTENENLLPHDTLKTDFTFVKPSILSLPKNQHLMVTGNSRGGLALYTQETDKTMSTSFLNLVRNSVKIYPNPFFDKIYIQKYQYQAGNIEIYDANAKLAHKKILQKGNNLNIFNAQNLNEGYYLALFKLPDFSFCQKLIKLN